jgi:hypothetical protein
MKLNFSRQDRQGRKVREDLVFSFSNPGQIFLARASVFVRKAPQVFAFLARLARELLRLG